MRNTLKAAMAAMIVLMIALPALAVEKVQIDGVLHMKNPATPTNGNRVIDLEEVWRHGGEDDEDFFGMVSQCVVGDDGTIYLLDTRMAEIPVYSSDGERTGTLSRQGDGPGETRMPSNLLFLPTGDLGIVQVFPGRITTIGLDGTPGPVINVGGPATQGGFLQMFDCVTAGPDLIVTAEKIDPQGPTAQKRINFVASFDLQGTEQVRFFEQSVDWDFTNFTWDEAEINRVDFRAVAAGPDGRVYIASQRDAYRIEVFNADGTLERVIERDYEPVARTDSEYNQMMTLLETQLAPIPNAQIKIRRTLPDIGGLVFGNDGNLWVSTSRSGREQPEGILATYDVFTPDGEFIETVSARCPGEGDNDVLFWTPTGDAVVVTGFQDAAMALQSQGALAEGEDGEAEPMEVIYYRRAS